MAESSSSVGKSVTELGVATTNHPSYVTFANAVEDALVTLVGKRTEAKAASRACVVTVALEGEEISTLQDAFPEFVLTTFPSERPAHAWFVQYRRLADDWLALMAEKHGRSVRHFGGSPVPYVLKGASDVQLVADLLDPVAVHDKYAANMDLYRLFQRFPAVAQEVGEKMKREAYTDFLAGRGVRYLRGDQLDIDVADALCINGCVTAMNPVQVAAAMMQAEASVAFGCYIYSPSMLFEDSGELAGTGVVYQRTEQGMRFKYPEGASGVALYPGSTWDAWTTSHTIEAGVGDQRRFFQLELLKNRGHLMFYRIVALPERPEAARLAHALDLPDAADKYLLSTWELKTARANASRSSNWQQVRFLADKRLVDRVYGFAMQLDKREFTRYAVRKQVQVVNDRVVVEGTSVNVRSPLGVRYVTRVSNAVYTKAFVDRYETGELLKDLLKKSSLMLALDSYSTVKRSAVLAWLCATTAWDYTAGAVLSWIGDAADAGRDMMDFTPNGFLNDISIMEQPLYVLVKDLVNPTKAARAISMRSIVHDADRLAALKSKGPCSALAKCWGRVWQAVGASSEASFPVTEATLAFAGRAYDPMVADTYSKVRSLNEVDEAPAGREQIDVLIAKRIDELERVDYSVDPDPVWTLNRFYEEVIPGVALQNLEYDTASISYDSQDRVLAAPYLKLPLNFGDGPKPRAYYHSKLRALNVPKRQNTMQELLSSVASRNLNAPQVSLPQDEDAAIREIWANFLNMACIPGAEDKLRSYAADPVGITGEAFRDWAGQSTPDKLAAVRRELEVNSRSLAEMDVGDYMIMLKADAKPTLSTKPLVNRTEPQVIVYHDKYTSAMYSCMVRVLSRRFLSLLKPEFHVNLLKDTSDMERFLQGVHPFGESLQYLENDFSKYDKSQGRFVFKLEEFVFRKLGLNEEFLQKWVDGHVECSLRAVALGLSLKVFYQRKSGDATTAFGNVLLNVLSVSHAYRGSSVAWALFMGDDSLVACRKIAGREEGVQLLAEVFNLGAKNYITNSPYFASNFVVVDEVNRRIRLVGDPLKRVERWSGMIAAEDPQWRERWVSAKDSMKSYLSCAKVVGLEHRVAERYAVEPAAVAGVADAIATVIGDEKKFRAIWEEEFQLSIY